MTAKPSPKDWLMFGVISLVWGSAYVMTRAAVTDLHPLWVVVLRLTLGCAAVLAVAMAMGEKLPPLSDRKRWGFMAALGFFGMVGPFILISYAQRTVDSALAGLYVAAAPILVALGAQYLLRVDKLDARRGVGVAIGFVGMIILLGPEAARGFTDASTAAQFALLGATACYAASTLLTRMAPPMPPMTFASGFILSATLMAWPITLIAMPEWTAPSWTGALAVIGLGLGPSGFVSVIYVMLIRSAGPVFMSLTGYTVPFVAAALGWLVYGEQLSPRAWFAFALILGGVYLAQSQASKAKAGSTP